MGAREDVKSGPVKRPRRSKFSVDPETTARCSGLRYLMDDGPGIRRRKSGKTFSYVGDNGRVIRDAELLERIRMLVIPPAWEDVWISPFEDGHLQVTGIDARGRKQYRYHERWRQARDASKYEKMLSFATCLPKIRKQVQHDINLKGLPREKVLATVVRLLEATCIRVGNESYARENESYGLTTLRNYHVNVRKCDIRFHFVGKSGKEHNVHLTDCALASIVKKCRARPGELLFQYMDDAGNDRRVTSTDVNRYLRSICNQSVTAKDFRTWWGTVLAALALREYAAPTSQTMAKRQITTVVKQVATHLGNTPTICRKCYIHPAVMTAFSEGRNLGRVTRAANGGSRVGGVVVTDLLPEEKAVVRFLKQEWASEVKP